MNVSQPQVYCPNLNCSAPLNTLGNEVCENCQTPLVYRYLWVVGDAVLTVPVSSMVAGRYYVKAPQVWLDTQPALQPDFPGAELPDDIQAYLQLSLYRLHLPEVYGVCAVPTPENAEQEHVILLENAPLDEKGVVYPTISQSWASATAVRQVYWLWQLLELWNPLAEQGAKASLLISDNIRVEGWRVRLCQLFWDEGLTDSIDTNEQPVQPLTLADLAILWLGWVDQAHPDVADALRNLCYEMRSDSVEFNAIATALNRLLLQQAAQFPLRLQVASKTDSGPQYQHNEDSCYPPASINGSSDDASLRLVVVCDGIGGHEGGEIASQLAVQSLKLQVPALLTEIADQPDLTPPEIVAEQLEAIVRVINDLIATQNDTQGREARRRMGTTLVMGLQLPQKIAVTESTIGENSHELYLVNVGDSRAYWITPRYCHCLTLDDDVAVREVRMGRMLYREALQRPDAGSLIQALGTRDSEFLHPTVQRFILQEDGVLLLCSDGLSDNGLVETYWATLMSDVFRGKRSLDAVANEWIQLANQKNGHDNVTVVLLRCHVSSPNPEIMLPPMAPESASDWSDSSRALLERNAATETASLETQPRKPQKTTWLWLLLLVGVLLLGGYAVWQQLGARQGQNQEQIAPPQ